MKKLVVSIATVGLTMCNSGGAVDPAPPPLMCSSVGDGGSLNASATVNGTKLTVTIDTFEFSWKPTPSLSNVVGASVTSIMSTGNTVTIVFDLSSDAGADAGASTSGSFVFHGTITDNVSSCPVTRTFNFTITNQSAQITQLEDDLPLRDRAPANIHVMGRDEREVRLRASGARPSDTIVWTVSDGELREKKGEVRWILPSEPGLYQVEVLVDRGGDGVALDTLVMEVT